MEKIELADHGVEIAVRRAGVASRPALLLLHGWPHSHALYEPVIDALAERFFVLAPDLPAVGESRGAPSSAEKTVLADVLLAAAERAGAHDIVVAGIDVGGMIAFAAARDHGRRIRGAVVTNTVIPGLDPWEQLLADPRIWHFAFHAIPELPETMVQGRQRPYFDYFCDLLAGHKSAVTDAYRERFAAAYARPQALKAGFDWYRALAADAKHNARPKAIETPLLYLRGDADGRSPDDYLPGLRRAGARELTAAVLPDCGEFAPLEAPRAFVDALVRFAPSLHA
ncbi:MULTISPECIES: alpha/beta fold hydrolase [unclassified Rhizobacter]|uniref:alpha/beta fold hydrolase n=1 Tax=unclassified Rhizobacter TaxID=2640088 RepID=UPI0006FEBB62|nr:MULTISPECIES: alpha/beta hydrolase [unclassified Rhizobacter]KQU64556.1 alpha/beta hydrolase [Rhizobacter sp. Root29]KQW03374.1 alpha/beta hydrolase [Rhizobacter sp. Root1238]KRB13706.1 alpha/beta hydrolase [Rhizobacter sp. Root16D2]